MKKLVFIFVFLLVLVAVPFGVAFAEDNDYFQYLSQYANNAVYLGRYEYNYSSDATFTGTYDYTVCMYKDYSGVEFNTGAYFGTSTKSAVTAATTSPSMHPAISKEVSAYVWNKNGNVVRMESDMAGGHDDDVAVAVATLPALAYTGAAKHYVFVSITEGGETTFIANGRFTRTR